MRLKPGWWISIALLAGTLAQGQDAKVDSTRWMLEVSTRDVKFGRKIGGGDIYAFLNFSGTWGIGSDEYRRNDTVLLSDDWFPLAEDGSLTFGAGFDKYWKREFGRLGVREELSTTHPPRQDADYTIYELSSYTGAIFLVDLGNVSLGFSLGPQLTWRYERTTYRDSAYSQFSRSHKGTIEGVGEVLGRYSF